MTDPRSAKKAASKRAKVEETGQDPTVGDGHGADEEKVLDGDPSADYPAVLTKDTPGG